VKAFLLAVIVAVGMGFGAALILESSQLSAQSKFSGSNVRN
jgi:hypothetical protein